MAGTSKVEADKVCTKLASGLGRRGTATQRQQILMAVEAANFQEEDISRIVAAMSQEGASQEDSKQTWAINNLLTKEVAEDMAKDVGGAHVCLIRHLVRLGLWQPTEATLQLLATILMLNSGDVPTTAKGKNGFLKSCRRWWALYKGARPSTPQPTIVTTAQCIKHHNITTYTTVFGEGGERLHTPFKLSAITEVLNGSWMQWHKSRDNDARRTETGAVGNLDTGAVGIVLAALQHMQTFQQQDALPNLFPKTHCT